VISRSAGTKPRLFPVFHIAPQFVRLSGPFAVGFTQYPLDAEVLVQSAKISANKISNEKIMFNYRAKYSTKISAKTSAKIP